MSTAATAGTRQARTPRDVTGAGEGGPADQQIIAGYGFWIFLLSDIIMFSAFFATYEVLLGATAGGPTGRDLFDLNNVALESACLLASSFTCGLASVAVYVRSALWTQIALLTTGILGAIFLGLEIHEFAGMLMRNTGPTRSAFLSAFFSLVGAHGLHVAAGLLWLVTMMAQLFVKGFSPPFLRRVWCLTLFWHTLDIIWIAIFTIVYLMGMANG